MNSSEQMSDYTKPMSQVGSLLFKLWTDMSHETVRNDQGEDKADDWHILIKNITDSFADTDAARKIHRALSKQDQYDLWYSGHMAEVTLQAASKSYLRAFYYNSSSHPAVHDGNLSPAISQCEALAKESGLLPGEEWRKHVDPPSASLEERLLGEAYKPFAIACGWAAEWRKQASDRQEATNNASRATQDDGA